jgi:hypothetical protein
MCICRNNPFNQKNFKALIVALFLFENILSKILDICKVCFTFGKSNFTIMKSRFLFPYWSKFLGYLFLLIDLPFIVLKGDDTKNLGFLSNEQNFFIATILILITAILLIAFSKEKIEDEQIAQLRLDSLQWAIYLNYIVLIICFLTYKGDNVRSVLHFNLKFPLIFFILRFRWVIFRRNWAARKEADLS